MSKETVLIALGAITALSPYLGLPLSVLEILLPVIGLLVALVGIALRTRSKRLPAVVYEAPDA